MSLLKTKQIAGPTSGQHGSVILFDGGKAGWSSDLNGALMLPSGPTSERPEESTGGHIRFNETTGKLEAFEGGSWKNVISDAELLKKYAVRVNFDNVQKIASVTELPNGWSIVGDPAGSQAFTFTQNIGKLPFDMTALGQSSAATPTVFQGRSKNTTFNFSFDSTNITTVSVVGVSPSNTGTYAGGYSYIWFYF